MQEIAKVTFNTDGPSPSEVLTVTPNNIRVTVFDATRTQLAALVEAGRVLLDLLPPGVEQPTPAVIASLIRRLELKHGPWSPAPSPPPANPANN
jgi:hypothetical protein